jgi:hypothetical protein
VWTCADADGKWQGMRDLRVVLEHDLYELPAMRLPEPGSCEQNIILDPEEFLHEGHDLPDDWKLNWGGWTDRGQLERAWAGLYRGEGWKSDERCGQLNQHLAAGLVLKGEHPLRGARTPPAGRWTTATWDGMELKKLKSFGPGDEFVLGWNTSGWDQSYVEIQKLAQDRPRESIICNTTGPKHLRVNQRVWSLFDPTVIGTRYSVTIGQQNVSTSLSIAEHEVQVVTRATASVLSEEPD